MQPAPSTTETLAVPHGRGAMAVNLISQMAFGLLAMTLCLPSMHEWGDIFQAGPATVQLAFSGYLFTYGALQLVYGPLSDRHGRRRLLIIGLAISLVASLAAAASTSIEALIAARIVQGSGAAACLVVGRAAVQDLFHGPERTRVMAYVGMAMGLVPPLGTVIGGQMHVHFGWASNFLLLALMAAVLIVAAWRGLPVHRADGHPETHWLRAMGQSYMRLAREPAFLLNVGILSMTAAAFYVFLSSAPMVLKTYGIGPGTVGWFIMLTPLSYIAGNFMASRLVQHRDGHWLRNAGQATVSAGIVVMLLLAWAGVQSPFAFSLPLMLMGIGHGLLMPTTLAATVGIVPALAGAAAAVAGVAQQVLGAFAGASVGWVSYETPVPVGLLMLAFTGLAMLSQVLLHRR
jgi:DHA1 family bicyclomycin/chloramphenicol resistance-like MFS transporter